MIDLHPEILRRDGKAQFAVIPWEEFVRLREMLEDAEDVLELRRAKENDAGEPSIPLAEVLKRFGMEGAG